MKQLSADSAFVVFGRLFSSIVLEHIAAKNYSNYAFNKNGGGFFCCRFCLVVFQQTLS